MAYRCIFCHKPVERSDTDNGIKTLTKVNSEGYVVVTLCHLTCYEQWRASRPDRNRLTEIGGQRDEAG